MLALVSLSALFAPAIPQHEDLALTAQPEAVEVLSGPIVLHSDLFIQWGGHTFSYLLEGERGVFWSGKRSRSGPAVIGQFPHAGSDLPVRVT